jgi:putative protease
MSQFTFNKSANRGECLQNCRRSYIIKDIQDGHELELENNKVLSAKDLCTLPFIEKIKNAGVISFKIEGRNRDPRYVETVIRVYRNALDKKLSKNEIIDGINELKKVYNRGFSSGFYLGLPSAEDFSKTENSEATTKKHFVGKVLHYLPKISVALVKVSSPFNLGDEIVVIGERTGIINSKIERLEINKKSVSNAKKGDEVGIRLPRVRKNDEIYVVSENK